MHKIPGTYDLKKFALIIALDKHHKQSKALYKSIKSYVIYNMFIGFRRQAARLQRLLITSVGDHLEPNGDQRVPDADLWLDIEVTDSVPKIALEIIEKSPNWHVEVNLIDSERNEVVDTLYVCIRKSDGYIVR